MVCANHHYRISLETALDKSTQITEYLICHLQICKFQTLMKLIYIFSIYFSLSFLYILSMGYRFANQFDISILIRLTTVTRKSFASIKLSCLHFGQKRGKFFNSVSARICNLVLFPQTGQSIHFVLSLSIGFILVI